MTDNPKYVPRINVDITKEMQDDLNELLPWGVRKHIIHKLLLALFVLLKKDKETTIGAILSTDIIIKMEVKNGKPS